MKNFEPILKTADRYDRTTIKRVVTNFIENLDKTKIIRDIPTRAQTTTFRAFDLPANVIKYMQDAVDEVIRVQQEEESKIAAKKLQQEEDILNNEIKPIRVQSRENWGQWDHFVFKGLNYTVKTIENMSFSQNMKLFIEDICKVYKFAINQIHKQGIKDIDFFIDVRRLHFIEEKQFESYISFAHRIDGTFNDLIDGYKSKFGVMENMYNISFNDIKKQSSDVDASQLLGDEYVKYFSIESLYIGRESIGFGSDDINDKTIETHIGKLKLTNMSKLGEKTCFYDCLGSDYRDDEGVDPTIDGINKAFKKAKFLGTICVYAIQDEKIIELCRYKHKKDTTTGKTIIFYKNHWYRTNISVKNQIKIKAEKPKLDTERIICVFDLETYKCTQINENKHIVKTFSCVAAYYKFSDMMDEDFDSTKYIDKFYTSIHESGDMVINEFLNDISHKATQYGHITCISHNGSKFDTVFILNAIAQNANWYIQFGSIVDTTSIKRLVTNKATFCDSCLILTDSLKKLCESFKTKHQKTTSGPTFDQVNDHANGVKLLSETELKQFEEYNINDVLCLADIVSKIIIYLPKAAQLNEEQTKIFNKQIFNEMFTSANIAKRIACMKSPQLAENFELGSDIKKDNKKFETIDDYTWMRKAIYAGRVSPIKKDAFYNNPMVMVDICSSYPNSMYKCNMPVGLPQKTDSYKEGYLGIYNCRIIRQPDTTIIPLRTEKEPLNFNYRDEFDCVLCSVDIEEIRHYGGEIQVTNGVYWLESSADLFKPYLTPVFKTKAEQDALPKSKRNNSLRNLSKLLMNSLSGKVIQNVETNQFSAIYDTNLSKIGYRIDKIDLHRNTTLIFGKKDVELKDVNSIPIWYGIFIYAYSRANLYKCFRYGGLYSDTDSVIMKLDDFNRFAQENVELLARGTDFDELNTISIGDNKLIKPTGFVYEKDEKALGSFEIENWIPEGRTYILDKKTYGFFTEKPAYIGGEFGVSSKYRLKGISKEKAVYNDTKTLFKDNPETFYKTRIETGEKVAFDCVGFMRSVASSNQGKASLDIIQVEMTKFV